MNPKQCYVAVLTVSMAASAGGQTPFVVADKLPTKCGLPHVLEIMREAGLPGKEIDLQQLFPREERQKTFVTGNFRIHYDTSGVDAAAMLNTAFQPIPGTANQFADSVGAIANAVWNIETGLGYVSPPSDGVAGGGLDEYDIYVKDLGNTYGQTLTETALDNKPDGVRYTTYIEIDNDFVFVNPPSNRGLPALRVTLAHEFHHAIQLGGYGFWLDHIYYYEITSVWMEDVAFTDVNDYYQYLYSTQSQFSKPEVPFNTSSLIMYSRGIWNHYVSKRFGPEAIRRSWEHILDVPPLQAIDLALQEQPYASSFREAFSEWAVWNYFTGTRHDDAYYPEGSSYPLIAEDERQFSTPADTISGELLPLATAYHTVFSVGSPLTLSMPNVDLDQAMTSETVPYAFYLSANQIDEAYLPTLSGLYVKRDVQDPFAWGTWAIVNGLATKLGASVPVIAGEAPFPNPFLADGTNTVNIPVESAFSIMGELHIYSDDMDLVSSTTVYSRSQQGRQVFQWSGKQDSGETARSGIYLFVLNLPGQTLRGKIALIAK